MVYFDNGFIVFGGHSTDTTIARLDIPTTAWSKLGKLKSGRHGHGVIYDGKAFMVIGGNGSYKTEKCLLSGTSITCTEQTPTLENYDITPALIMVPEDFCTEI